MITWINNDTDHEDTDYPNGPIKILFIIHNDENQFIYYVRP